GELHFLPRRPRSFDVADERIDADVPEGLNDARAFQIEHELFVDTFERTPRARCSVRTRAFPTNVALFSEIEAACLRKGACGEAAFDADVRDVAGKRPTDREVPSVDDGAAASFVIDAVDDEVEVERAFTQCCAMIVH